MNTPRNEIKYQWLKLTHSGRTLREAKALTKAAAGGLHPEYASAKDLKDLAALEGFNHLLMTRGQAVNVMTLKLKPRPSYPSTREEAIAKWATGYRGGLPLDWKRDGNLVRRGRPNKPRPGSSKNKIRKTRVSGAHQTLKDFEMLIRELQKLVREHGGKNTADLRKAFKSVRTSVNSSVVKAGG